MSTVAIPSKNAKLVRGSGWFVAVVGVVMIIAGIAVWSITSSGLAARQMTDESGSTISTPWQALGQINLIGEHMDAMTDAAAIEAKTPDSVLLPLIADGTLPEHATYATVPSAQAKDVWSKITTEQQDALKGLRTTVMNGSLLQGSLYVSVIAFGVAFLVFGLGIIFALIGVVFLGLIPRAAKAQKAEATA